MLSTTMHFHSLLLLSLLACCCVVMEAQDAQQSITCLHNQHVVNGQCNNCQPDTTRRAGDSVNGGDTQCVSRTHNPICKSLVESQKSETSSCATLASNVCGNYYETGHQSHCTLNTGDGDVNTPCQYCDDANCCSTASDGGDCVSKNPGAVQCLSSSRHCGEGAIHSYAMCSLKSSGDSQQPTCTKLDDFRQCGDGYYGSFNGTHCMATNLTAQEKVANGAMAGTSSGERWFTILLPSLPVDSVTGTVDHVIHSCPLGKYSEIISEI